MPLTKARPPRALPQPPAAATRRGPGAVILLVTTVAALASAQIEGYLMQVHPGMAKLAPGMFLLAWVAHRLWTRRPLVTFHPIVAAVAALAMVVMISAATHLDNGYAVESLLRWLPFLVLTVALVDVLSHDVHPSAALSALMVGALIAGAGALVSFVVLDSPRATGPLEDPNDLAYVLTAAAPIALVRLGRARGRRALALALVLAVLLAGSAATVSRGGAMAVMATLGYVVWRRLVPGRLLAFGAGLLAVVAALVLTVAYDQIQVALDQKRYIASTNIETRTLRWEAALRMLGSNPLLGVGPGGARSGYVKYSGFAELAEPTPVTHQMYLEVGAELGALGLAAFLATILAAFVAAELAIRRLHRAHVPPDDATLLTAFACQASLLALCTSSFFLSEEYYLPLWAAVAVAAALEVRTRNRRTVAAP